MKFTIKRNVRFFVANSGMRVGNGVVEILNHRIARKLNVYMRLKAIEILLAIDNGIDYGMDIARHINFAYGSVSETIRIYEKHGLVEVTRKGRTNHLKLTERGHKIVNSIRAIIRIME